MNLVAARGIVAMHKHRRVSEISKISRTARMVENNLLVKFFEFRTHEKKRTAARRISIMRSISAVVFKLKRSYGVCAATDAGAAALQSSSASASLRMHLFG